MELTDTFAQRRVLITGGLGFIGSNLARRLAEMGAQITLVDSLIPEYGGNLFNIAGLDGLSGHAVRVNISDVRDEHSMAYLVQGQDYLFNGRARPAISTRCRTPTPIWRSTAGRSSRSWRPAASTTRPSKLYSPPSARQIYGRPDTLSVDEKHLLRPVDVNGINKMAGEWYHILYNNVYGLRASTLRLTNTYGPRMRVRDARQTFLGIWIRLLVEGRPFEVWDGQQLRDFTYVDDAVEALLLAAAAKEANGRAFNLGGDEVISLEALARLLAPEACQRWRGVHRPGLPGRPQTHRHRRLLRRRSADSCRTGLAAARAAARGTGAHVGVLSRVPELLSVAPLGPVIDRARRPTEGERCPKRFPKLTRAPITWRTKAKSTRLSQPC